MHEKKSTHTHLFSIEKQSTLKSVLRYVWTLREKPQKALGLMVDGKPSPRNHQNDRFELFWSCAAATHRSDIKFCSLHFHHPKAYISMKLKEKKKKKDFFAYPCVKFWLKSTRDRAHYILQIFFFFFPFLFLLPLLHGRQKKKNLNVSLPPLFLNFARKWGADDFDPYFIFEPKDSHIWLDWVLKSWTS